MKTNYVISKDGTKIAYETLGTIGMPLILIDGAMCFRESGPMRPLAEKAQSDFIVYAYDRRGRGESSDTAPYAVEREIEDIEAIIEAAGGQAYLYGISSGAVLALKAAHSLGEKIYALAMYEAPVVLSVAQQEEALRFTESVDIALANDDRDKAVLLFMKRVMKALGMPEETISSMAGTPMWDSMKMLAPTIGYDNHVMGDSGIPDVATDLTAPTLVAVGGTSPKTMKEAAKALAAAIPNCTEITIPDQSHDIKPDVLAPILIEFYKEHLQAIK